jgi:hypothetical protein
MITEDFQKKEAEFLGNQKMNELLDNAYEQKKLFDEANKRMRGDVEEDTQLIFTCTKEEMQELRDLLQWKKSFQEWEENVGKEISAELPAGPLNYQKGFTDGANEVCDYLVSHLDGIPGAESLFALVKATRAHILKQYQLSSEVDRLKVELEEQRKDPVADAREEWERKIGVALYTASIELQQMIKAGQRYALGSQQVVDLVEKWKKRAKEFGYTGEQQ